MLRLFPSRNLAFGGRRSVFARRRGYLYLEELERRTVLSLLTPALVRHAYGFDQVEFGVNDKSIRGDGQGQTIAIVNAYDNPTIESDLRHFDRTFGLPDPPSIKKATPQGLPPVEEGWSLETALDVEWAHAIAPRANILLVEAKSAKLGNLLQAVDYARKQPGVVAISMSWGRSELQLTTLLDEYFTTPVGHVGGSGLLGGITFVAASGDSGAGAEWPAVSRNVIGVGGTRLDLDVNGNYTGESSWVHSGGGLSSYHEQPAYQRNVQQTGRRSTPDVAYHSDPSIAFPVYHTATGGEWYAVGGTSAGAPQWAALVAIADQGRALSGKGSLDGSTQTLPALYQLADHPDGAFFHTVATEDNSSSAASGPSPNVTTGLGSPVADQIIHFLASSSSAPSGAVESSASTETSATTDTTRAPAGPQPGSGRTTPPARKDAPKKDAPNADSPKKDSPNLDDSQEDPEAIRVRALRQVLATIPPIYQSPTAAQTYAAPAAAERAPLGVPATDPRLLPGFKSPTPVSEIHVESGGGDNPVLLDLPDAQKKDSAWRIAPQIGTGMLTDGLLASQIRLESATRWIGDRAASLAESTAAPAVADDAAALSSAIGESRLAANVLIAAGGLVMVLGGCWARSSERFANLKRKWFVRFPRA